MRDYVAAAVRAPVEERGSDEREKTGVALERTVTNPVNGEEIPMYVADYVLMEYGTGALMAVPAHDERDHAFARKFGIEIREVVSGGDDIQAEPYVGDGVMVNSGRFDGAGNREAYGRIIDWLADRRPRREPRSTIACATGCSRASATGAVRSRSSTARAAAWSWSPTTSCRSNCPRSRTTRPRARARLPPPRIGSTPPARSAAARHVARPTRWTRSSTPRGTSCATSTRTTRSGPGRASRSTTGCRSTNTSAGSSTRSCTCSTRASSARRSPTSASSTCRSRSRTSSPRG